MQSTLLCLLIDESFPLVDVPPKTFVMCGGFHCRFSQMKIVLDSRTSNDVEHCHGIVIILYYGINSSISAYIHHPRNN
jgi:hypothetical protein